MPFHVSCVVNDKKYVHQQVLAVAVERYKLTYQASCCNVSMYILNDKGTSIDAVDAKAGSSVHV